MGLSLGLPLLLRAFWKFRDGKPMKPLTHLRAWQIVAASNVNFSCLHLPSAPQTFLKCQLILWSPCHTVPHLSSNIHKHMPTACFRGTHSYQESLFFFFFWLHHAACGIRVPWPGIEPRPLATRHKVLTSESPGKSQGSPVLFCIFFQVVCLLLFLHRKPGVALSASPSATGEVRVTQLCPTLCSPRTVHGILHSINTHSLSEPLSP